LRIYNFLNEKIYNSLGEHFSKNVLAFLLSQRIQIAQESKYEIRDTRYEKEILNRYSLLVLRNSINERSEPSSRIFLNGEQPYPWDLLQPQDKMSRHRGAELRRRYELLGGTSLLSLE
jgi:hypothetical protein